MILNTHQVHTNIIYMYIYVSLYRLGLARLATNVSAEKQINIKEKTLIQLTVTTRTILVFLWHDPSNPHPTTNIYSNHNYSI